MSTPDPMNPGKYLGEFPIDISTHPKYKNYTPSDWAMTFVERYGGIDGDHHKTWVLDQVARCLKGVPMVVVEARWESGFKEIRSWTDKNGSDQYRAWVKEMLGEETDGEYEYNYDEGIAP
jgi:hypothetical protein